jgi:hypothetical protein
VLSRTPSKHSAWWMVTCLSKLRIRQHTAPSLPSPIRTLRSAGPIDFEENGLRTLQKTSSKVGLGLSSLTYGRGAARATCRLPRRILLPRRFTSCEYCNVHFFFFLQLIDLNSSLCCNCRQRDSQHRKKKGPEAEERAQKIVRREPPAFRARPKPLSQQSVVGRTGGGG